MRKFALIVWLVLGLAWCPGLAHAEESVDLEESYRIQVGDRVEVKIYPEDEFIKGGPMEVSSEGNVTLPLMGKVSVVDKTVIEAERTIAEVLARDFIVNPEVVIEILEYKTQSVVLLGQVKKPGTYKFPAGSTQFTLLQAISMAGGFSDIANPKKMKVMRRDETGRQKAIHVNADSIIGGKKKDLELQAGDVIHVPESLF